VEHDNTPQQAVGYDRRLAEYISEFGFTPAMFLAESRRHKEHIDGIRSDIKDMVKKVDVLNEAILRLPCDKHEGARMVLETRVEALENKPKEDMRIVYISMLGCGAIGGLIVSGVLKLGELVKQAIGL